MDKTNQDSPGHLKKYKDQSWPQISIINIDLIEDFKLVSDIDGHHSSHKIPVLIKFDEKYMCIHNFNIIKSGAIQLEDNVKKIQCIIIKSVDSFDNSVVAIEKAEYKIVPSAGICSYAGKVIIVNQLVNILKNHGTTFLSHGGNRHNTTDDNCNNDGYSIISKKLGLARATTSKYRQHGQQLTKQALQFVNRLQPTKSFFEEFQKIKRSLIGRMENKGTAETSINNIIHAILIRACVQYKEGKPINCQKPFMEFFQPEVNSSNLVINDQETDIALSLNEQDLDEHQFEPYRIEVDSDNDQSNTVRIEATKNILDTLMADISNCDGTKQTITQLVTAMYATIMEIN